ncbi:MAG: DNA-directed RNA polymerase subunit beta', partial [Clostridia bacterium]|nr:DNA-directed RNA polymerase subunit beta' [Clostridia bacterium]
SGRSVIVVGPELKLHQCGLPKEMALELFKPFVMQQLQARHHVANVKAAKRAVEKMQPVVWDILEDVIKDHPVLLNRAPTLHRLGIQAFEPVLVDGKAIKLHPLACTAFNADFDGDQMAVHVPLSMEAQAEARFLMLGHNNILKPQDGKPVMSPSQDMVIGCYYLTIDNPNGKGAGHWETAEDGSRYWVGKTFRNPAEAHMAYALGEIDLQSPIRVRIEREFNGERGFKTIECTLGRLIFNDALPQNLGFKKRECLDDMFDLEINELCGKNQLGNIVDMCFRSQGEHKCALVLDAIKTLGYKYATVGALTVSVADIKIPPMKQQMLDDTDEKVAKVNDLFQDGLLSEDERYMRVIDLWNSCTHSLRDQILPNLDKFNPIRMFTDSGARGSAAQVSQLAGMRGLMASPTGKTVELPIRANFREGLNVLEFFLSSHGSRKALSDTAMKTADSGYLTRRLVDISQEVIVREEDCFENRGKPVRGVQITELMSGKQSIESLEDRLRGRTAAEDIVDPATGEVIVRLNDPIDHEKARTIVKAGIKSAYVRSVLNCMTENGVCARCYGQNMAHGGKVDIGEAVGIIAAQAIGEPGTQLTMRTFHTGGIASGEDITQGLPRVEELFEARKPKREAVLSDISGRVSIQQNKGKSELVVTAENLTYDKRDYAARLIQPIVSDGEVIEKGALLYNTFVPPTGSRSITVRSEIAGTVRIAESIGRCELTIIPSEADEQPVTYVSSMGNINVKHGALVTQGEVLVKDILIPGSTKNYTIKSELTGRVTMMPTETEVHLLVDAVEGVYETKSYPITYGSRLKVQDGDVIKHGDVLIEGSINPHDLLRILGPHAVQDYLLKEVLSVYRLQGVAVADKHIEIIVRQMLRKVRVEDNGDTDLLPGSLVDLNRLEEANQKVLMEGGRPAYVKRVLLGITKASLATDSFLSAASFQETNRVLTEAAIKGKIDPLIGLKENVILGKLIPAGTGMRRYKGIEIRENYGY